MLTVKQNTIFVMSAIFSVMIHLCVGMFVYTDIHTTKIPVIYSWLDILRRPQGIGNELGRKNKGIPSKLINAESVRSKVKVSSVVPLELDDTRLARRPLLTQSSGRNYLFLWEKKAIFPSGNREIIPFKVYVSSLGKVVFMYPQRLPVESLAGITTENYLKSSLIFQNDIFFWTKIGGVVE